MVAPAPVQRELEFSALFVVTYKQEKVHSPQGYPVSAHRFLNHNNPELLLKVYVTTIATWGIHSMAL